MFHFSSKKARGVDLAVGAVSFAVIASSNSRELLGIASLWDAAWDLRPMVVYKGKVGRRGYLFGVVAIHLLSD